MKKKYHRTHPVQKKSETQKYMSLKNINTSHQYPKRRINIRLSYIIFYRPTKTPHM